MSVLAFDYDKLRGRIREKCKSETAFAKALGLSRTTLSGRLNNKLDFSAKEITRACEVLGLPDADIPAYFFEAKVQKHEH